MIIAIGGVVLLAIIYDANGTVKLVATALSIRGTTWIVKKVTENINVDASKIIDFAGWSLAGISIVKIISNAMGSIGTVRESAVKLAEFLDKITFWN